MTHEKRNEKILEDRLNGLSNEDVAKKYGLTVTTIKKIFTAECRKRFPKK